MAFVDYYKIMGVPKDYPQEKMKEAYRKRARKFHPDLHPEDPKAKAKFQALNEANEVLSDPEKRQKYDQFGEHWREAGGFGGQGGAGGFDPNGFGGFDFSQFSGGGGFSSFFEDLFGGGARRGGAGGFGFHAQPEDLTVNAQVDIDMYTALLGGDIVIQASGSKLKLKVKPETQNGTKVKLRGKGRLGRNGTVGDLVITYNIVLPTGLNAQQKELLRQMQMAR